MVSGLATVMGTTTTESVIRTIKLYEKKYFAKCSTQEASVQTTRHK